MQTLAGWTIGLTTVALFLPFLLSLRAALKPVARPKSIGDYFLYERNLDAGSFVTATTGYAMQAAAIFLFLWWFPDYGLWTLIVPIAWFGGYALIAVLLQRGVFDEFLMTSSANAMTIHGFVASRPEAGSTFSSTLLKRLLALSTIFGIVGTLSAEIDYAATSFVFPVMGFADAGPFYLVGFQLIILAFCGSYILWGGYKAAVDTDRHQVLPAYVLLATVILYFAWRGGGSYGWGVAAVTALLFGLFAARRLLIRKSAGTSYRHGYVDIVFFGSIACAACAVAIGVFVYGSTIPTVTTDVLPHRASFGFGIAGVFSLLIANFLWQLIDISSYQRLQSVRLSDMTGENSGRRALRSAIIAAGVEGGGVWILLIGFALLVSVAGFSPSSLYEFFTQSPKVGVILLPAFAFVVMAFMISTVDSLVSACAYVVYYDILGRREAIEAEIIAVDPVVQMRVPRRVTFVFLAVTFAIYSGMRSLMPPVFISQLLYGVYAIQAAILPAVFCRIILKRPVNVFAAIASIVVSWIVAIWCATSSKPDVLGFISDFSWSVLPPLAAVSSGFVVYYVALAMTRLIESDPRRAMTKSCG